MEGLNLEKNYTLIYVKTNENKSSTQIYSIILPSEFSVDDDI